MSKAKLRKKIKRLKKRELALITECNAARARAGELWERFEPTEQSIYYLDGAGFWQMVKGEKPN